MFGGNNIDIQPSDVPQGLSTGNSDVAFLPGSVFTRPPLKRLSSVGTTAQCVYATTFLKPDGKLVQVQFFSDGKMYADGVQFGQTQPGNRFFTCNAFGKLYIAISDGQHGADVPLQLTPEGFLDRVSQDAPGAAPTVSNVSIPASVIVSGSRVDNEVTIVTDGPHGLQKGYLATIANVDAFIQNITSIVIDEDNLPGVATITTPSPHGLVPGNSISLSGIQQIIPGTAFVSWSRTNQVVTVTTATAHHLRPGVQVSVELGNDGFGLTTVTGVPSPTTFTFSNSGGNDSGTEGGLFLPWPFASGTLFTVQATPTTTTFQVSLDFVTSTWNTGFISFGWNGSFYVENVISSTSFTYRQLGPDASIVNSGGTVTPTGQLAAGDHEVCQHFVTRTGYITAPSPSFRFTASGSQYVRVENLAIGPSNVIGRILSFTGANGANFFYLPVAPQVNGQIVGTGTVINDNTTTSAILDFSDESLIAGTAIDIPGNNLFNLQVLGPCLGFFNYASRLITWGERNKIQQFLNMGFEGGILAGAPNVPLGWKVTGSDGSITPGDYGNAWTATTATLSQTAYQDRFGIAIIQPNTQYTLRQWVNGHSIVTLTSASTGYISTASVTGNGNFAEAQFSSKTPAVIPPDLTLTISQQGTTTHDEIEIIYTQNPYILTAKASYVNNPESFDGVTGVFGPASDPHPILGMEERKDVLCLITAGPEGSLYETEDTPSGEPATWNVRHIASQCGLTSVWGAAKFEDWFCWTSDTGLRIFDGSTVDKMSQEIQPWWNSINSAAKQFTVLANDPYTRRIYVAAPINSATVPNSLYVLDYRDLNTAGQLANSGTVHVGYTGRVVTTDLTRKWSPWSMTMNYIGLVNLTPGSAVMAFCGGTGGSLNDPLHSAVYTLLEGSVDGIDDDYGPYWDKCQYPTYFMISAEEAAQLQLGKHRLLHRFITANCTGVGSVYITPWLDRVGNEGRSTRALAVAEDLPRDLEFALNNSAERISYVIRCKPTSENGPAGFRLSLLTLALQIHPYSPIRGKNF